MINLRTMKPSTRENRATIITGAMDPDHQHVCVMTTGVKRHVVYQIHNPVLAMKWRVGGIDI